MLLHANTSSVEVSDGFQSSSFTIVDSQNSFSLLQGKQYEDPIKATLRALVENALDAHVDSHTTEPVKISAHHHKIVVQDAGLGISPDTFEQHFTKFFASNRTHSNAYHGFFGVGAKAPLAVAQQFRVCTIHEGTQYTWLCKRGTPAPTAELLESIPASSTLVGTSITLDIDDMDSSFREPRTWGYAAADLAQQIPQSLSLEGDYIRHIRANPYDAPHLILGSMPYPLPTKEALNLPAVLYQPLAISYLEESAVPPLHTGKNFGTRKASASTPVKKMRSRTESIAIKFDIGEIDLHFSKERVASTPLNIEKIRSKALQTWLDWQLGLAQEFSASKYAEFNNWRMAPEAAQALRQQGQPRALLAWASRPLDINGPVDLLNESDVTMVLRSPEKPALSTAKKWVAAIGHSSASQAAQAWAQEWGLTLHWEHSTAKHNMAIVLTQALSADTLIAYDSHVEDSMHKLSTHSPLVVLTMDDEWAGLDKKIKNDIATWLSLTDTKYVMVTSLSLADVQTIMPQCIALKEHCQNEFNSMLAAFPEDALGIKTATFSNTRRTEVWVSQRWPGPHAFVKNNYIESTIEMYKSMHSWLSIPEIEYVNVDAWVALQKEKMPLLALLNDNLSTENLQHINEMLSHP